MKIESVTVIGANGTMGRNVGAIFASFGNCKVYMVSRTVEKSEKAIVKAADSVRANCVQNNMFPRDYSQLETCIHKSDLVFESVAEDLKVKQHITELIGNYASETTIICTGTSGLSIETLSKSLPEKLRKNYLGVHFFNPPYNLNLCEIIQGSKTNRELFETLKVFLREQLLRTVVEVKDKPAFLGNRIGFQFINELLQCAEKYQYSGGIDYIDAIMGGFTGRSMAPLVTTDFVGLDIHKAIVNNIYENTDDYARNTFSFPGFADHLVEHGNVGRKVGRGLYSIRIGENGIKERMVYDIENDDYRPVINYQFPFVDKIISYLKDGEYKNAYKYLVKNESQEAVLCVQFLLKYILYSLKMSDEIGYNIHAADDAMASGFNWCPPLAMIDLFQTFTDFGKLVNERIEKKIIQKLDLSLLLEKIVRSNYDYRRYIKAIR